MNDYELVRRELEAFRTEIDRRDDLLATLRYEVHNLSETIVALDAQLASTVSRLAARNRECQALVADLDRSKADAQSLRAQSAAQVQALRKSRSHSLARLRFHRGRLAAIRAELDRAEARVLAVEASWSWRVTRPLRYLAQVVGFRPSENRER